MPTAKLQGTASSLAIAPTSPRTPSRLRVCHMVVRGTLDGAQRSMLDICRRLDPRRFERHVVCQSEGPLTDELRELDIEFHLVPELDRSIHPWRDASALRKLQDLCRRKAFDLVHTHSSKTGLLGRVAARFAGVPCVIHHVRGFAFHEFSSPVARWMLSRIEKWAGRWCDRVVFVNHEERRMSIQRSWLPAEKCTTVYNGVELDRFAPESSAANRWAMREEIGADPDEVLICSAAG